jgi:PKD repeat protein
MYKKLLSISMAIFLLGEVNGQQQVKVPHKSLLEAKNSKELQAIYEQNIKAELTYAKEVLGLNIEPQILLDGTVIQLVGVSENGIPKYIKTDNAGAAKTIGTDKVHPGGSLGFNLSGSGMTNRIGIWDGGAVRVSHQEFQGRAVQTDGTTTLSDHATHVAGTMIAGGVQANAKGMSFQAPLKCYFWDNDVSEMNTAAGSGMLVSNHSYGSVCGWNYDDANTQWRWYGDVSLSSTEDYKFGLYNDDAQAWDQTVYNNPFYLPFKSAGNDRGDVPSTAATRVYFNSNTGNWVPFSGATPPADGQYDCISTNGVAKNILTIGAVNKITNGWNGASSVVMSSFSGWGPTDDGRIKPDICAAGVDLYSSYSGNNTAYSTISGTSMASPNATGSALLIQQHYNNLKGKFLRASSLKGLIIHTADEAGSNPGPDYSFGWGLMNTAKAVQSISDSGANQIIESQIPTDLTPFVKTVVSNGTVPLKITLCWTDIAATASSSNVFDDQVAKLINDLDVRVVRVSDNQQFLPYILNPATPNAAATNGDNFRDNVEQIFIAAPSAGAYTIKVTSKRGFPNNFSQSFSLIIGGISPKPAANFSASAQMSCVGSQITFTNNSSSSNTAIWYFPGGSPSTSTSANPVVTYSAAGNYPVALKVTGVSGEDSLYKLDYIKIGGLTLPVIETFESNSQTANLWRVGNIYNDTFSFRKWTNALGTTPGNTVVGVNFYDNPITTRRYQLYSPILDLRGMQNANLSFQHAYSRYDGTSKDSLIVSISSNCGSTWTRLVGMTENRPSNGSKMATYTGVGDPAQTSQYAFVPSLPADWCSTNINSTPCNSIGLNSFVGLNNVIIRFEVYYGGGNNLFLDNINITGTPFSPKAGFKVPSLVCANQNTVLTDTSLNNPSTWNWVITGPQNFTSTSKNPSFNFSSTGLYTVKLKVSNVSGSDSVTVTNSFEVKASPAKPAVSLSGSLILCNNDSSLLTTTSSNLQWYRDSVAIVGEINSNYYNKNAGKIAVRTMGSNGCSAQSDLYTFSTGTNPPVPTITKSLAGNQFCEGGSFTLTSSATSANTWMRNGVNMPGQTATTLSFNDSGTFNVKVSNGVCSSISVPLTISKLPRPNTSDITASKFAYKNDTASYWVNGLPTSSYNWTVSGGIIQSGQNTNNIVVKWSTGTNGVVQVTEKGTNGCNGVLKTYPVGIWNTAVSNVSNNNDFILFPNPTNQFININYLGSTINNLNITVFDVFGKKVLSQDVNLNNNNQQVLDLANLAKGVYIIKLVSDNFSGSKIITKE